MANAKLTPKQARFIDEYLIDLNATQAAIRAGYSKRTAYRTGADNLKKPHIQEYIAKKLNKAQKRTEITVDRVLKEYARIAFFDPRKLFNEDGSPKAINELDDDTAACIAGLEVSEVYEGSGENREFVGYLKKYKIVDKKGSLDSLGKHLGMFIEKMQISGQIDNPFAGLTTEQLLKLAGEENADTG